MKMLIANLMALGVLGATTAATAQSQTPNEPTPAERARAHDAQERQTQANDRRQDVRQHQVQAADQRQMRRVDQRQDLRQDRQDIRQRQVQNFDRRQFQRNVQATRRFRAGFYRAPPGFAYRRWTYGQRLPGIYFAQNYWLTNWFTFGLFAPPEGLVWVRYGSDALLVDRVSGDIVQVRYGVFY